jgi:membrane-bound serine protease (ClpP class)
MGWAALLTILALALILAEVFFPSFGLFGVMAGGMILLADVTAFEESEALGWAFIAAQVILIPLVVRTGFRVLPKLPFGKRMVLSGPATAPAPGVADLRRLLGRTGRAVTDLRPAGVAEFGEERVPVVGLGGMIPRSSEVVVVAVEGIEVRVRAVADSVSSPS